MSRNQDLKPGATIWVQRIWIIHNTRKNPTNPKCTCPISHTTPFWNRNMHISVPNWCIVGYVTGALWDFWDCSIHNNVGGSILRHRSWTKRPTFCRRHFEMHFLEWNKFSVFYSIFTEVCYLESDWYWHRKHWFPVMAWHRTGDRPLLETNVYDIWRHQTTVQWRQMALPRREARIQRNIDFHQ